MKKEDLRECIKNDELSITELKENKFDYKCFPDLQTQLENKFIYLNSCLYQIVKGNIGKNSISLRNFITGDFARHCNGIIIDSKFTSEEIFLFDSSFYIELLGKEIRLYCSNEELKKHCIVSHDGITFRIVDIDNFNSEELNSKFIVIDLDESSLKHNFLFDNTSNKKVVVFGSSSSEVFDHIFRDNPDYMAFWMAGWSARGLRKPQKYISSYRMHLQKISEESIILLNFGISDIDFGLSYKAHTQGYYQCSEFLNEIVDGILEFKKYLYNEFGFGRVYAVFSSPIIPVPLDYFQKKFGFHQLPSRMRGKMLLDVSNKLSDVMPVINCLPDFYEAEDNPVCAKEYMREDGDVLDHHISFVKSKYIVYKRLKENIYDIFPASFECE